MGTQVCVLKDIQAFVVSLSISTCEFEGTHNALEALLCPRQLVCSCFASANIKWHRFARVEGSIFCIKMQNATFHGTIGTKAAEYSQNCQPHISSLQVDAIVHVQSAKLFQEY